MDEEERLYMYHCLNSEEMAQILSNTESLRQDMSIIFKEMLMIFLESNIKNVR